MLTGTMVEKIRPVSYTHLKQTGTTYISKRTDFEGEHLGAWVQTQKHRYKIGKMSTDKKIALLEVDEDFFK